MLPKKSKKIATAIALVFLSLSSFAQWADLFDGKTLNGWAVKSGTATYEVSNGEIIGTTATGSPNTFLCTEKEYGDFVLEFEVYLVSSELNSGVQFRSLLSEQEQVYWFRNNEGVPSKRVIPANRLYGYQVEIANAANGNSGGVYDEGRRAFMIWAPAEGSEESKAFKDNQWNKYRVECKGSSIKTFINGLACADFLDAMTASGVIGLQVHGIGKDQGPYQVKWRNLRIMEL